MAITPPPSCGHTVAFDYGVTAAILLWPNGPRIVCDQVFHSRLPHHSGLGPSGTNSLTSSRSLRGSRDEGHWVKDDHTQDWDPLALSMRVRQCSLFTPSVPCFPPWKARGIVSHTSV